MLLLAKSEPKATKQLLGLSLADAADNTETILCLTVVRDRRGILLTRDASDRQH
jgi:hypothetical protein